MLSRVEGFVNAVPELKETLRLLVGSYARKETNAQVLGRSVRRVFADYLKEQLKYITDIYQGKAVMLAYLDVARYQTDVIDAAIEWGVDDEALEFLVEIAPPPTSTEERLGLDVPAELKRLRERN